MPYFFSPKGVLALDVDGNKIYWSDGLFGDPFITKIRRANLDGSEAVELVSGFYGHNGIALDIDGGKMYWTWTGLDALIGRIQRANLDGTGVETLISGLSTPIGLALTVDNPMPIAVEDPAELPRAYDLSPPYPNPFNTEAAFTLTVEQAQHARVALYDALGRRVALLPNGPVQVHQTHRFTIASPGEGSPGFGMEARWAFLRSQKASFIQNGSGGFGTKH